MCLMTVVNVIGIKKKNYGDNINFINIIISAHIL